MDRSAKPAGHDELVGLFGPLDDETLVALEATGASLSELMEAREWLEQNDGIVARLGHPSSPRVVAVIELLAAVAEREEPDEPAVAEPFTEG